jgi:aspartyl-tRNA(Asn)/glutamyl-tRNA(Gln) amidotransferase subunit C
MLAFVEQLQEVNVDGVEPMTSVMPMEMKKRIDAVTDGEIVDLVTQNAPEADDNFFLVPKVVE